MSAFSVGESGLKSSQDSNRLMSFVFFHPKFKLQEFLARRLFVAANNKSCGSLLQSDSLSGKKQMGPDRMASKSRTSRIEGRLGSGRGILSRQLPTIVFL